ncbi:hypothetical protein [Idiomarina sp. HP20-50]|uniref:hypothetical protein n=1 Tax=Idiomarina sp. HP20-50 TaxID=3070813 RepID=UPI00294B7CC5|nr:hypothetical protein [Idiomarina sp. HP20-50]MDV6314814.1 hypothetical protein [Idiomarina sp. HP20-50]
MSRKSKSLERVAAEEIDLDFDRDDEKFDLIDQHVAKEFSFVSPKNRVLFYRWLELFLDKYPTRSHVDLHGSVKSDQLLTSEKVAALLSTPETSLDLNSYWKRGSRAIRDRVREENKAERDRIVAIPISVSRRDKDRFEDFKHGLDYEATNKEALIELLNLSESFEPAVKMRVREKYENLLEENKKLRKAKEGKFTKQQHRIRLERLEEALTMLFDASFGMSVEEYLKHHRQLKTLEEGHKRIAAENSSSTKNDDTEKPE